MGQICKRNWFLNSKAQTTNSKTCSQNEEDGKAKRIGAQKKKSLALPNFRMQICCINKSSSPSQRVCKYFLLGESRSGSSVQKALGLKLLPTWRTGRVPALLLVREEGWSGLRCLCWDLTERQRATALVSL